MRINQHLILGFITAVLCTCSFKFIAQADRIDSLRKIIFLAKHDTIKIKGLNELAWHLRNLNADTAIILSNEALELATAKKASLPAHDIKKNMARSYQQLGWFYFLKSEFGLALENNSKALVLLEELKDKNGKAIVLGNFGIVYSSQGNYPKALDFLLQALKVAEEMAKSNNADLRKSAKQRIAAVTGNIGIVYYNQVNYSKALEFYFKTLQLGRELGDKARISTQLGNIGVIYMEIADSMNANKSIKNSPETDSLNKTALVYFQKALKMDIELNDKKGICMDFGNIGIAYQNLGKYLSAKEYYFKSLAIAEELQDKVSITNQLCNIGTLYSEEKKFDKAEEYLMKALEIQKETGMIERQMQTEGWISELYENTSRYSQAIEHFKNMRSLKDTLFNAEKNQELTKHEMNYEFEKKEMALKAEQEKKDAVAVSEGRKQKTILAFISCLLLLVFVFTGFVFRMLRITRRQKKILEVKSKEIEEQRHIIEEKNKDILDSIYYARRIQLSLLPTERYIERNLKGLKK